MALRRVLLLWTFFFSSSSVVSWRYEAFDEITSWSVLARWFVNDRGWRTVEN